METKTKVTLDFNVELDFHHGESRVYCEVPELTLKESGGDLTLKICERALRQERPDVIYDFVTDIDGELLFRTRHYEELQIRSNTESE